MGSSIRIIIKEFHLKWCGLCIEEMEQPLLDVSDCHMFKELGNTGRPTKTFNEVVRKVDRGLTENMAAKRVGWKNGTNKACSRDMG